MEQIQKLRSKTSVDLTDAAAPGPVKPGPLTPSGHTPSGHGGNPPHTTTSSGSGGGGVSKSSGPGPDFQAPVNPRGPRLNPLHGLNLDANNPTTNTGTGTSTNTNTGSGTGNSTGASSTSTSTGSGTGTGTGSGIGNGSGAGTTGSSGASHGGTNSGSQQPHTNTGSSTSTGSGTGATSTSSGSGHANTSTSTGTGSTVGTGSGHPSTGHGAGAGSGASHTGTSSGSSTGSSGAGHSGANSGASQQPHANTSNTPRPDPLIEKPRPHHNPENTTNGNGDTESPTSGKNPEHPHPKDLSTPTTRNNNGDTPHTQEHTDPSSRGNPHVHGGDSTPTDNHNPPHPPTKPSPEHHPTDPNHPTDPDHPTNPEHPSQADDGSSPTGQNTSPDASKLPDPPTVETWDGKEIPNTLRPGQAKERFGVDYTDADVKHAYDNAFDPTKGEHVDPRTGEPLVETTRDGRGRGWEMRYDPATKEWSAWNKGDGYGRAGKPIAFPDYNPAVGKTYSSGDGLAPGDPHPHTPPETHNRATGTPGVEHVNRGNTGGKENPKIENWLKYQEQITGWKRNNNGEMPEYTLYDSNGKPVRIDGRTWRGHPPQEVYLDAKRGYQRVYYDPASSKGIKDNLIDEADRQLGVLPPGAKLEWHISSREGADAISRILEDARIYDVDVIYTPER